MTTAERAMKVLVIDDDLDVRVSIRMALEASGHDVGEAGDGEDGMYQLKYATYDLVIVDLMMPNKEGMETIREIRALYSDLPIITISGANIHGRIDYLEMSKDLGASATLRKPFSGEELLAVISQVSPPKTP